MSLLFKYAISVGLLAVGAVSFLLLSQWKDSPEKVPRDPQVPAVTTTPVRERSEGFDLEADGEVFPYREVTISSEVAGTVKVKTPQCFAGQYVKQGTVLLQIETDDYDLEVRRIDELAKQATINGEELDLERTNTLKLIELADEDLQLQRKELERITALNRRNVATESDLDTARRNELASRNNMQTLQNQKSLLAKRRVRAISEQKQINAELRKAKLDQMRTEIRAPIDGVVTEDLVEAGAFVERGAAVARIEDTSRVEVHFNLQYNQLQWLWQYTDSDESKDAKIPGSNYDLPNLPIDITLALEDGVYQWQGFLARYDGAGVNAATRTVPCVAIVKDRSPTSIGKNGLGDVAAPPALLRGMFVTLQIKIDPKRPLLAVPTSAIRPGDRVWLLQDSKLNTEEVDVVMIVDQQALILADQAAIREGDQVITSPLPLPVIGMPLRKVGQTATSSPQSSPSRGS
ncbi:MAG: HlyD family efflux transporter periplasmic adaptor subunit [Pirellulales bacterium]|nr:HlyD family efflux transporter periplasmic adaptor subunit [Pirellulales bacterium]